MMQTMPKWLSLITLWILWISFALPANQRVCDLIDKNGVLHMKNVDINSVNAICDCESVKSLSFKKGNYVALPDCASANVVIESISFSKTKIQRLPTGLENFENLRHLDLSFTEIVFLPDEIANLYALRTLNLRGTKIVSLPDGLENLEMIDMRMIDLNREAQEAIRAQYPEVKIYFSSPCKCY